MQPFSLQAALAIDSLTHSEVFDVGRDGRPLDDLVGSQVLLRDGAPQLAAQVGRYLALVERPLPLIIQFNTNRFMAVAKLFEIK